MTSEVSLMLIRFDDRFKVVFTVMVSPDSEADVGPAANAALGSANTPTQGQDHTSR